MNPLRFIQTVHSDNSARTLADRRKRIPDLARATRNLALGPLDSALATRHADRMRPVFFILGAPRSGTTLFFQLLTRYLAVSYPSNELARFWSAPLVGAYYLRARRHALRPGSSFTSSFGRDHEDYGPHEFSWFWHHWGDFRNHDDHRGRERDCADWDAITRRLTALSSFYAAPLLVKSINFTNYHTRHLAELLPNARFLWISRDPLYCAQSILEARRRRYGDPRVWWSVRPRDVAQWRDASPVDQVVHQIGDIESALAVGQAELSTDRFLRVRYEDLVRDPQRVVSTTSEFLDTTITDPEELERIEFKSRNQITLDPGTLSDLKVRLAESSLEDRECEP